ncbi:MAG: histidinol-phosphate aminotransferase family protein [Magnetococcales bacterium]|nr:histidinol-phosphate aminotransferase family protein [Magnetococcales bacterium]
MEIKPTKFTLSCSRIPNEEFDRTSYVRLDKNENTVGYPDTLIREMLSTVTPAMVSSYPEPYRLQNQLAQFLGVERSRLLLTTGSDAGIKNCFEAFITPQDRFIRVDPTYAMVGVYATLFGTQEIKVGYDDQLNLEFDRLINEINIGAKLVYIANPNSPTGTILSLDLLRTILLTAEKSGAVVIIDEAYYYFSTVSAIPLLNEFENLIITRTFSKAMGLASVRLGFVISSPKIIGWLLRWRPMYEINAFAQYLGSFILDHWSYSEKYVQEVVDTKKWFASRLAKMGLYSYPSHTNFILVRFAQERIDATAEEFKEHGILIKGGGGHFPLSHALRFSIGSRQQMEKCLVLLEAQQSNFK